MTEKLLRQVDVENRVGLKKSKLYDMITEGRFPRPIKLGGVNVWPESRISAWIADIIAASEAEAA